MNPLMQRGLFLAIGYKRKRNWDTFVRLWFLRFIRKMPNPGTPPSAHITNFEFACCELVRTLVSSYGRKTYSLIGTLPMQLVPEPSFLQWHRVVLYKVVHNNCATIAFMFNGGRCGGSIFCPIDTRICLILLIDSIKSYKQWSIQNRISNKIYMLLAFWQPRHIYVVHP